MTLVPFFGIDIEIGPDALRPRPETELLARTAIAKLAGSRAIDVCCGTGNLACAIAVAVPAVRFIACDLTDGCVALARRNVARLGLGDRITVLQGDLFAGVPSGDGPYDLITCNPPYISTSKLATRDDLADEPREAFDGGPYGVTIHQRVAREALPLLRAGGWLCFEFGLGQERQLELVIGRAKGYDAIEFFRDESGAPRVVAARRMENT
ncbi:MAG: peptide chain release factor N(5)-glutamine methyltransferase [Proteobacteria bacterium]|nr:peptide chain release factor N(5)-glutamine methyltransferase [Pseudomonadota bacterium]